MLRVQGELGDRCWAPAKRVLAAALLGGIAVSVWSLPAPVQGGDEKTKADVEKAAKPAPAKLIDTPAFDLSCIPADAMGVVAFHPAAAFRRQGMAQYASQLNALKAIKGLDKALEIPISKCPLKVEQIEQVTAAVKFNRVVQQNREMGTVSVHCFAIRTVEPFDWLGLFRSLWPNAAQLREGEKLYFKIHYPPLGPSPCFYFPDNRTMVADEEASLRRLIHRDSTAAPEFASGDDWKKVEHDLFAVVLDDRASQAIRKFVVEDEEGEEYRLVREFINSGNHWVLGLADADDFLVRVLVTCRDPGSPETISKLVTKLRDSWLKDLQIDSSKPPDGPRYDRERDLFIQIVKGIHVETHERSLSVESSRGVSLANALPLFKQVP